MTMIVAMTLVMGMSMIGNLVMTRAAVVTVMAGAGAMAMHSPLGRTKQSSRLMRRQIGHDLGAGHEAVLNPLEAMRLHHRVHDLAVDGQRHLDAGAFDQRGPMLVTERVTKLDAGAQRKQLSGDWRALIRSVHAMNRIICVYRLSATASG